ncbi:transmembrane amino acid transporter protein-domain-containing protein [Parasitella parasitica]|nr:transmembrane amino acid transporter protein-domain-containing protein [Parasitella parasitica]
MYSKQTESIRVPSNTHPSHSLRPNHYLSDEDDDEDRFYSAQGTPNSRPQSIRASIQNFAGSYSRASILYMADGISVQNSHTNVSDIPIIVQDDEEQFLFKQNDANLENNKAYRTFSQQTDMVQHTGYSSFEPLSRHATVASIISQQLCLVPSGTDQKHPQGEVCFVSKSSFLQSVFNAVNVLVGVGILALPLSLRLAGWLYGSLIFFFCCFATNYTAKIIIKCLNANSSDCGGTYGDMGQVAFGDKGRTLISTVFVIELITIGVAMIVLLGDGIQSLFPELDLISTRILSLCILTPTVFLPIKKLAYTSLIGIIACVSLVIIVLYDGLSKEQRPGSLFDPMDTEIIPNDISNLPLSFGLIMSGFAGHAVFPSIYRDMENPKQYNRMVDLTYQITAVIYFLMAIVGYLMFGQEALQEITQNLALIEDYSQLLNRFAIWLLVLTPIAKYGLMMQPLNMSWEIALFSNPKFESWLSVSWRKNALTIVGRSLVTALLVYIALVFPGFDKVMSLLGALFSFTISIIFPLVCHLRLFKEKMSIHETLMNWFLLVVSILLAIFGTVWSIRPCEL